MIDNNDSQRIDQDRKLVKKGWGYYENIPSQKLFEYQSLNKNDPFYKVAYVNIFCVFHSNCIC